MNVGKPNNTKLKVTSAIVVSFAVVMLLIASTVTKGQQSAQSGIVAATPASSSVSMTTPAATAAPPTTPATPAASTATSSGYIDGTYTATSSYYVPRSTESIQVSLTLKNGIITDSSIKNSESNRESAQYQQSFASIYKSYVTGKNISGLNLSYVAGASDTTQGFDDAMSKIQNQAKS